MRGVIGIAGALRGMLAVLGIPWGGTGRRNDNGGVCHDHCVVSHRIDPSDFQPPMMAWRSCSIIAMDGAEDVGADVGSAGAGSGAGSGSGSDSSSGCGSGSAASSTTEEPMGSTTSSSAGAGSLAGSGTGLSIGSVSSARRQSGLAIDAVSMRAYNRGPVAMGRT